MKKLAVLLLVVMSLQGTLVAQQKRLTDHWQFLKGDLGGIWEAVRPVPTGAPESVPLWEAVTLPHCVNAKDGVDPDVNYYQGPAWYRTNIPIENPLQNGRTLLHFEGAGQKTQVFIFTKKVGEHVGGYDEWTVDITDAVKAFRSDTATMKRFAGKVPVSIRTDNSRDVELIPSDLSDFNVYGGIYRHLNLVYAPAISVDKIFIEPVLDNTMKNGEVTIRARFFYPGTELKGDVTTRVLDPFGKLVSQQVKTLTSSDADLPIAIFKIPRPQLWSDVSPKRYTVECTIKFDGGEAVLREQFGFRQATFVSKGPFLLNGKRLLLRGTHRHEDHAGVGSAMTDKMMREEMIMMKEMGVNFIRLGHYQQSRTILDLCDSLGILVWEEIPWCRGGLGGETYREQARRMLTNMIEQHYNHPSVILWGLGNENDWPNDFSTFDKEAIRAFMKSLNDLSHKLDPSRKTAIRRCDFCKDIVDVYSPSIWAGWYRGAYTDYRSVSETEMLKVNHFLHVEWGGDSHAGRHSENPDAGLNDVISQKSADERAGDASLFGGPARASKDGDWSESYICNLIDWHLKEQLTMPWLSGTAYWPFKDFSTPVRPDNPIPYMNQKGVVERDFTKKEAYYVFQSWWTDKPMAHIYGHSWPIRWGGEAEARMVKVYSNCDEAELFVNEKSVGIKKRNPADFPASGLRWMVNFTAGVNSVRVVAKKGKVVVQDSLSVRYQTERWSKPATLNLSEVQREGNVATIEVTLADAKHIRCLDAREFVRFGLTGDAHLMDNMGTSSGSRYVQLYNGRAIIRVTMSGRSVISAACEGIPSAFLDLKFQP